jgi:hypothetical protein
LTILGDLLYCDINYLIDERDSDQLGGEYSSTADDEGRLIEAKLLALTTLQAIRISVLLNSFGNCTLVLGHEVWHHPSIQPFLISLTLSPVSLVRNQMHYILFGLSSITNIIWGVLQLSCASEKYQGLTWA